MDKMEQHTIIREGQPPLRFTGFKIGSYDSGYDDARGTEVSIYKTKGGKFVAHVRRWTRWQGERDYDVAKSVATFKEAIDYLTEENGGELGSISQAAIERAIQECPELREHFVEEVD